MTTGSVPYPVPAWGVKSRRVAAWLGLLAVLVLTWATMGLPALADDAAPSATVSNDFGQYVVDHQDDLAPFFKDNSADFFRLGVPMILSMLAWVIVITMVVGWAVDVLLSRGFAYFFAPAFAEIKRSLIYATGRLFLSFVYSGLLTMLIILGSNFTFAALLIGIGGTILVLVALAAQLVWILYLYRTNFAVSAVFYLAVLLAHTVLFFLMAEPLIGIKGNATVIAFVDQTITPRLKAAASATRQELAKTDSDRNSVKSKVADLENQVTQGDADAARLRNAIEEKKHSDLYVFSQIIQLRARGELASAHDQLVAFIAKFPSSSMNALAHAQLDAINAQMVVVDTQKKQADADSARAAEAARADLLARASRGELPLSEIRQVLIGKSRADVKGLLGAPTETGTDSWGYHQQMIVNPVTNEKSGLTVYFLEGMVQGVDYNRGTP